MQKHRWIIGIALVTALALGLRLWGIEWGLPNALHFYSYHTDETRILGVSRPGPDGLNLFAGQFLPHFYNYGSLQLYLINIAVSIVSAYMPAGHAPTGFTHLLYVDYLVGRLLTVAMGTGTVWALWAFGRRVYSEAAGLTGALLLALTPLHAQHSHFMTVDVPATFWVVLALLWSAKAHATEGGGLRAIALAGCFAGFATATKYNCALVFLPVLYASVTMPIEASKHAKLVRIGQIAAACAGLAAAYLLACPGTVLESGLFVRDFRFEALHVSSQQELWFQGTGIGWWYILVRNLGDGMGLPLLIAAIAGVVYAFRKRSLGDILTLSFALPYYIVVGAAVSRYARYEIPLLPVLALLAARLATDSSFELTQKQLVIVRAVGVAVVAFTALSTVLLLQPMSRQDPRDAAAAWIEANVPSQAVIGMPVSPWFWSVPLDPFFCSVGANLWMERPMAAEVAARIVPNYLSDATPSPFDTSVLRADRPPVVVMSEMEYFDKLRLHDPAAIGYVEALKQNYAPPIVFRDIHWLGGSKTIDGLPCQDLPIDMLYTSPTVLVFKRN